MILGCGFMVCFFFSAFRLTQEAHFQIHLRHTAGTRTLAAAVATKASKWQQHRRARAGEGQTASVTPAADAPQEEKDH